MIATVALLLVGGAADADDPLSVVAMVENWGIVADGEPFTSRPGAAFPQEVFNWRAQESIKWQNAQSKLSPDLCLAGKEALAALPQAEYEKQARLKHNVLMAFGTELSWGEHTRLAKAEAGRPQSFYDTRVREAFEWVMRQKTLRPEERLHTWEAALSKSKTELQAEIRARNEQGTKKPDDQERLVERVVDVLAAEFTFDVLFGEPPVKSPFGGSFLKAEAIQRIAAYDEEFELRFARCVAAMYLYRTTLINKPDFEDTVKGYLQIEARYTRLAEDSEYLEARVHVAEMRMTAQKKIVDFQPTRQKLEIIFNEAMTPDDAAVIARVTSLLKAGTTKDVLAVRKQVKEGLRQAVMKHPEALNLFAEALEPTEELRKSRQRVSELITQAQGGKQVDSVLPPFTETRSSTSQVTLKAKVARELNGWAAGDKAFLIVDLPLTKRETINVGKFQLQIEAKRVSNCIGILPPDKFTGTYLGTNSEVRDNDPIPGLDLRPAKEVEPGKGFTDITKLGLAIKTWQIKHSLIVGNDLVAKPEGDDDYFLTCPQITYLLSDDGYKYVVENKPEKKKEYPDYRSGWVLPLKDEVHLLFLVPNASIQKASVVGDDGITKALIIETPPEEKPKEPGTGSIFKRESSPAPSSGKSETKAIDLTVRVPVDAKLELEGVATDEKGEVRRFRIPAQPVGQEFKYNLKATWKENGRERTVLRTLRLRAGNSLDIDLRKPAGWPSYSGELAGSQEVRVKNPNDFKVTVGLRSAGKGKDFEVLANSTRSVLVANGSYEIYFQYSTDPEGLYKGDNFTLANNGVEIQIVRVVDGNYGIRRVN